MSSHDSIITWPYLISANAPALHDLWFLGDCFLKDTFNTYETIRYNAQCNKDYPPPYIEEYYNVHGLHDPPQAGIQHSLPRVINTLIDAINKKDKLPKYLIIILDCDLLYDLDVFQHGVTATIQELICWFVCQVDMIVRRKKMELLEKKPGTLSGGGLPKLIFVRMLRRVGKFHPDWRMYAMPYVGCVPI